MAASQLTLSFLSRSNAVAAQTLAAASPRILGVTPKSVSGTPTSRTFASVATPKTPARSPFSASPAKSDSSPFFGAASPVWNDLDMAAKASMETSAQLTRSALPSAASSRQHCLARLACRNTSNQMEKSSTKSLSTIDDNSDSDGPSEDRSDDGSIPSSGETARSFVDHDTPLHRQPRLGLGRRDDPVARTSGGWGEFQARLPTVLGKHRQEPAQALRTRYSEEQVPGIQDAAEAANLVRENFLRRRALVAERQAFMRSA